MECRNAKNPKLEAEGRKGIETKHPLNNRVEICVRQNKDICLKMERCGLDLTEILVATKPALTRDRLSPPL